MQDTQPETEELAEEAMKGSAGSLVGQRIRDRLIPYTSEQTYLKYEQGTPPPPVVFTDKGGGQLFEPLHLPYWD
jgi:hypothetical protein